MCVSKRSTFIFVFHARVKFKERNCQLSVKCTVRGTLRSTQMLRNQHHRVRYDNGSKDGNNTLREPHTYIHTPLLPMFIVPGTIKLTLALAYCKNTYYYLSLLS